VSDKQDQGTPDWAKKVSLATSGAGVVAGPAATYGAFRAARDNTGGMPRDLAQQYANAMKRAKSQRLREHGANIQRRVDWFNTPRGRKAKLAAIAAGGTGVTLQLAQNFGDATTTYYQSKDQRRKKVRVPRSRAQSRAGGVVKADDLVDRANDFLREAGYKQNGEPSAALRERQLQRAAHGKKKLPTPGQLEAAQAKTPVKIAGARLSSNDMKALLHPSRVSRTKRRHATAAAASTGAGAGLWIARGQALRGHNLIGEQLRADGRVEGGGKRLRMLSQSPDTRTRAERERKLAEQIKNRKGVTPLDRVHSWLAPKTNATRDLFRPQTVGSVSHQTNQALSAARNARRAELLQARKNTKVALGASLGLAGVAFQQNRRNTRRRWT
jgi:hypothetical protein